MSTRDEVLGYLSETEDYISGEKLAQKTGKSRAAIWKAIKALQKDGIKIDAVTNRGYKLEKGNDILSAGTIRANVDFDTKVLFYDSIDSTNTQAKRLINEGETGNMLLVAKEQTAGRGRQGKSFYSPADTGIYLSFVTHPMDSLQSAVTATTAAAVAVCRALEKLTDKKPKIKWVNDVYIDGKKICGILTEAVTDFETQTVTSVIIGIGVNITTQTFPDDVTNAGAISCNVSRAALAAEIANQLNKINTGRYEDFISYYRSHSMIIGEKINFIKNGESTPATAVAIDSRGGLEVELADGSHTVLRSGEISIRKRQ